MHSQTKMAAAGATIAPGPPEALGTRWSEKGATPQGYYRSDAEAALEAALQRGDDAQIAAATKAVEREKAQAAAAG